MPEGNSETDDVAAQHRVEPGHRVDFVVDRVAHRGGGNEEGQRDQRDEDRRERGGNGNREAFEANSRGHGMRSDVRWAGRIYGMADRLQT